MKKFSSLLIIATSLALALSCIENAACFGVSENADQLHSVNEVVKFPDPNLEKVIREAIGKQTGNIFESDVERITSLTAENKGIQSLEGIQNLINLMQLNIPYNDGIKDITPLKYLKNLYLLNIFHDNVEDISPIANLTNLTAINFSENQIINLEPLIYGSNAVELSPLSMLINLKALIYSNYYSYIDLFSLKNLENLEYLSIEYTRIDDLSPLYDLSKLKQIYAGHHYYWNRNDPNDDGHKKLWQDDPMYPKMLFGDDGVSWLGHIPEIQSPNINIELLDGIDFLNAEGTDVSNDPTVLSDGGIFVRGAAADGVTKLLVRASSDIPCSTQFSLEGTFTNNGELTTIISTNPSFAVYTTPKDFENLNLASNCLNIKININNLLYEGANLSYEFIKRVILTRPPVILMHGWNSDGEKCWGEMRPNLQGKIPGIRMFTASYPNYAHFEENRFYLNGFLLQTKNNLKDEGIAAIQADVIGHSMGGVLSRIWAGDERYKSSTNYHKGNIHKLITVDSPHNGSYFGDIAKIIYQSGQYPFIRAFRIIGYPIDDINGNFQGALEDLSLDSNPLKEMSAMAVDVPCHAIIGDFPLPLSQEPIIRLLKFIAKIPIPETFRSDLVVSIKSQASGIASSATSTFAEWHSGITKNSVLVDGTTDNKGLAELLNLPVNSDAFSYFPTNINIDEHDIAQYIQSVKGRLILQNYRNNLSGIRTESSQGIKITSQQNGSYVTPGDNITISVSNQGLRKDNIWDYLSK